MPVAPRICQFVPSVAPGDGVTNSALFIHKLLREMGAQTSLFSHRPPFELRSQAADIHLYNNRDWDLILVHHSMGHDLDQWIADLAIPRILIYHNITPATFFPPDSGHYFFAHKGLQQLEEWSGLFDGAIGDSALNSHHLEELGYRNIATVPLLVDPEKWQQQPQAFTHKLPDPFILAVGKLSANKRQHLMLDALEALRKLEIASSLERKNNNGNGAGKTHLILVGDNSDSHYLAQLQDQVHNLQLQDRVHFYGKVSDGHLVHLYQNATALWCTSEHEGFCMPLLEACIHKLPVVACNQPAVSDTLGSSGLIVDPADANAVAAATYLLLTRSDLRGHVVEQGIKNAARFSKQTLAGQFQQYLQPFLSSLRT